MASKEDILGQFQLFNIEPTGDVVSKCLEMCLNHNVGAEELVEQWFAYTSSVLKGAAPTVEYLKSMERKQFLKTKDQGVKKEPMTLEEQLPQQQSPALNSDILGTPKGMHTPVSKIQPPIQNKKLLDDESTINSQKIPSGMYSNRTDARSVRCYHKAMDAKFKRDSNIVLTVKPFYEDSLKPNQPFMYEIERKRIRCMNNMTEILIQAIKEKLFDGNTENEEEVEGINIFFGRIVSEPGGKINIQSVLLELTQKSKGRTLCLNFSKIFKYAIFPGQTVAIRGIFEKTSDKYRDKLLVKEIYCGTNLDLIPEPPVTSGSLQLVVASGPFTTEDSFTFEPLDDLLQYTKEYKPNVLMLMGPFYKQDHQGIKNGSLKQTFESFFFDIVDNIMKTLKDTDVHVIIVSSRKDPHHFPVYPTPPYEIRQQYDNLTFMPDPVVVNVNGLIIGATTADVLFDLSCFEVFMDKTSSGPPDRMGRLVSHLLKQHSFYPLYPATKDMRIDMSLMETHGTMGVKPHILVLPSNLRHFIKEIDDCLIINPERLTKGNGGGTFARIEIRSGSTATVCSRSAGQVLKI